MRRPVLAMAMYTGYDSSHYLPRPSTPACLHAVLHWQGVMGTKMSPLSSTRSTGTRLNTIELETCLSWVTSQVVQ